MKKKSSKVSCFIKYFTHKVVNLFPYPIQNIVNTRLKNGGERVGATSLLEAS